MSSQANAPYQAGMTGHYEKFLAQGTLAKFLAFAGDDKKTVNRYLAASQSYSKGLTAMIAKQRIEADKELDITIKLKNAVETEIGKAQEKINELALKMALKAADQANKQ